MKYGFFQQGFVQKFGKFSSKNNFINFFRKCHGNTLKQNASYKIVVAYEHLKFHYEGGHS